MRLTALGIKALAFWSVILVSYHVSPYTNLFFLLLAFLTAVLLLNLSWTFGHVRGVTAQVLEPRPHPAGATLRIAADLRGPARRPVFGVYVRLRIGRTWLSSDRCELLRGRRTANVRAEMKAPARGIHPIRDAFVESSYPLGLVCRRVRIDPPKEIVVFPAPSGFDPDDALQSPVDAGDALLAECGATAAVTDPSPTGLREYRPGDPPRDVHWRATARRPGLVVKTFDDHCGDRGLEVVLDRRCAIDALEPALSILTTFALRAREKKEPLSVKTQGLARTYGGEGQEPVDTLLRWLAAAEALPADAPAPPRCGAGALRLPRPMPGPVPGRSSRSEVLA